MIHGADAAHQELPFHAQVEQAGAERHHEAQAGEDEGRGADQRLGEGSDGGRDVLGARRSGSRRRCDPGRRSPRRTSRGSPSNTPANAPPMAANGSVPICRRCSKSVSTMTIAPRRKAVISASAGSRARRSSSRIRCMPLSVAAALPMCLGGRTAGQRPAQTHLQANTLRAPAGTGRRNPWRHRSGFGSAAARSGRP